MRWYSLDPAFGPGPLQSLDRALSRQDTFPQTEEFSREHWAIDLLQQSSDGHAVDEDVRLSVTLYALGHNDVMLVHCGHGHEEDALRQADVLLRSQGLFLRGGFA
jgi:hypothetical protein